MAEFVQNHLIKNFLDPPNNIEQNFYDSKLFGIDKIENNPNDNPLNADDDDRDNSDISCDCCHQTCACPNDLMTTYIATAKNEVKKLLNATLKKKISLLYNTAYSEAVSTDLNDYFLKPIYTWFPETWINNGNLTALKCPGCKNTRMVTREKISFRNVECIDTNAFILFSKFKCMQCSYTFDALNCDEGNIAEAGIPLSILQRCPIGGMDVMIIIILKNIIKLIIIIIIIIIIILIIIIIIIIIITIIIIEKHNYNNNNNNNNNNNIIII
jgi:hypothetical protein